MKLLSATPKYLLGLVLFFIMGSSQMYAQESANDTQITSMLFSFYKGYIAENSKIPVDPIQINSIREKYCTRELIQKLGKVELDHDPFLNTQDCKESWLKTLVIKKDPHAKEIFVISFFDAESKSKMIVKLRVQKQNKIFKISAIL